MLSNSDLYGWIDSEGGVEGLIRHGMGEDEFEDPITEKLWKAAIDGYVPAMEAADALMQYLEENSEDADPVEEDCND